MYRDFRNGTAITLPHLWFIDLKLAETFQNRVFTFCKDFVKKVVHSNFLCHRKPRIQPKEIKTTHYSQTLDKLKVSIPGDTRKVPCKKSTLQMLAELWWLMAVNAKQPLKWAT